jgi:hypothetical protein
MMNIWNEEIFTFSFNGGRMPDKPSNELTVVGVERFFN